MNVVNHRNKMPVLHITNRKIFFDLAGQRAVVESRRIGERAGFLLQQVTRHRSSMSGTRSRGLTRRQTDPGDFICHRGSMKYSIVVSR